MKILFVNNFRGRGGGEEFLRDLLPGLVSKGVEVGLICRPDTPLVEMFRDSDIAVHPIARSGIEGVSAVFKTAAVIRSSGYEVVNIQRGHDIVQSWVGARFSGRKPVLMYTPQVPEFLKWRFLLSRMDRIVTISRYIRDKITSFAPNIASRTEIIYYGIDLAKFRQGNIRRGLLRTRFGLPDTTPLIGTVGDLWKNQIEFLDALRLVRKELPDARFVLVASESDAAFVGAFRRRASELGLTEAVLWTGRLAKDDMISFYADIDVAISTHRNEGFGIWVLEALAMGVPVVSANEGGIRDSLEGCPAGCLVDGDSQEMASRIIGILNDRALRNKMSTAGPEWVAERFSRERMVEDYHSFFEGLVRDNKLQPRNHARMNILQMISKNDRYGAQRIFLDQVATLHSRGHNVTVVVRGTEGYVSDSVRAMGVACHGISMKGIRDILFLRRLIRENKIDVIHTTLDRADHAGFILSRLTGRPVVSTMMVPRIHPGYRFMSHIITLVNKQADLLRAKGIRREKISVVRPGIDLRRFSCPDESKKDVWRKKLGCDAFSLIFCHVSSMLERKAHRVSLEITSECKKRGEEPLLIFIGDPVEGEYYESLLKRGTELGIRENIRFTGWTSEVPEILSLSHFTLLPSENEALGVVLMEGMAAGTPIVARKGEGGAELIKEYGTGFLYDPEQPVSLLAERIVGLKRDAARFNTMSEKCKLIAKTDFSLENFGRKLENVYAVVPRRC